MAGELVNMGDIFDRLKVV